MPSGTLRCALSASCLALWMVLLLTGHVLGGLAYLLLPVALLLFPWRLPR